MSKIITIGEALIDFIPDRKGCALSEVQSFSRAPGGAPANVAAACAILGGESIFLGKVGEDAFGDFLIETLQKSGVGTSHIMRTSRANTALAFVSLKSDGDRDFMFYRSPSADMLLEPEEVPERIFSRGDFLHFCSVDLIEAPVKQAHYRAIEYAKKNGAFISFDPNLRFPLWESKQALKNTVREFLQFADIVKLAEDEVEFVTDCPSIEDASRLLLANGAKIVIVTKGKDGAEVFAEDYHINHAGFRANAVDTTGAGDAFIGAFLYTLASNAGKITSRTLIREALEFACAAASISTERKGAISSYPTLNEVKKIKN